MGWEAVYVLVVHPKQLLKLAKQQQHHNTFNCSRQSNSPVPNQSSPYHTILQTRQSNSTVPNQTAPYHTILQTRHSMRRRIRLFQIRIPHTTQFSKPLSAVACSLCPYTSFGPSQLCSKMEVHAMMVCEKSKLSRCDAHFVTKHFRQNMFIALKFINII